MMSKQQRFGLTEDSLKDAFKIFDKDDDGFLSVDELRNVMLSLGERMGEHELEEMIGEADKDRDGLINYEGEMIPMRQSRCSLESFRIRPSLVPQRKEQEEKEEEGEGQGEQREQQQPCQRSQR